MRTNGNHSTKNGQRGFSSVEAALIMPLFLLMLMGVIDFGRLFWMQNVVTEAANEGARVAMFQGPSEQDVTDTVQEWLQRGGLEEVPQITVSARTPSEPVEVTVSIPFQFLTLASLISDDLQLNQITATSVMIHER